MRHAYSLVAMALAASAGPALVEVHVEERPNTNAPRQRKTKWIKGPFVLTGTEPQREDYPSRQAWRQELRRWSKAQ